MTLTPDDLRAMRERCEQLLKWRPQDVPIQFTQKHNPYNYDRKVRVPQSELDEDVKAPFFSEAYLYNLLGKEDARSLLARIESLLETDLPLALDEIARLQARVTSMEATVNYHADCRPNRMQAEKQERLNRQLTSEAADYVVRIRQLEAALTIDRIEAALLSKSADWRFCATIREQATAIHAALTAPEEGR